MIPPPSPATRGQAGGRRRRRGSGCQQPGWGVQRGLPGLTQAAHLLPCSWGRGRGSPSSREGSGGNSVSSPCSIPILLPASPQEPGDPLPTTLEDATLPASLPLPASRSSLEEGCRGGRGTGRQMLPSPGSPSPAQEIRGYFISRSHVLGMKGRWGKKESVHTGERGGHKTQVSGTAAACRRPRAAQPSPAQLLRSLPPASPRWPPARARLQIQWSFWLQPALVSPEWDPLTTVRS